MSDHFALDEELKIWISSEEFPAETIQFRKDKNIISIQQALASATL